MTEKLRPESQELVDRIKGRTGLPVQLVAVKGLAVAATITLSPHATDSYVLQYRSGIPFKDYAVALQCGHLLRVLAVPAADRRQFAVHPSGFAWGTKLARAHLRMTSKAALPDSVVDSFVSQLVGGLLTQLRSIPVGMRVEDWLADTYPTLADQRAESIEMQQQEAATSLGPEVKAMVPDELVAGSILLNTAYALFCDRLLGTMTYEVPYASAGFKELGGALLRLYDETPSDPASDIGLVDSWAAEIGLSGKYQWVPFPSPLTQVS